jgi:hypothetical protein
VKIALPNSAPSALSPTRGVDPVDRTVRFARRGSRFCDRALHGLHKRNGTSHAPLHDTTNPRSAVTKAPDNPGRSRADRGRAAEGGCAGRGRPGLCADLRTARSRTGRGRDGGKAAVGGAASGTGASGSEGDAGDKFGHMFKRRALAVSFAVEPVTEEVTADAVVDAGGEHPVLERMSERVEGMAGCFQ